MHSRGFAPLLTLHPELGYSDTAPNIGLEPTPYSVRYAPASRRGSGPAFGFGTNGNRIMERITYKQNLCAMKTRGRKGCAVGIGIILLYMAMRFAVYAGFPIESWWHWWARDTLMNIPRLLAFGLSLWTGLHLWGRQLFGWHAERPASGLVLGFCAVVLGMMEHVLRTQPVDNSHFMFVVLCFSSLIVALWEETLFRGVMFTALADWHNTSVALWGSSALFAVYHVQAQPVSGWPSIFLSGFLWAVMRSQGVGLWWLILAHAILDSIIFLGSHGPAKFAWWPPLTLTLQALFVGVYYLWSRRHPQPLGVST